MKKTAKKAATATFRSLLTAYRAKTGKGTPLTMVEAAEDLGVSRQFLYAVVNGEKSFAEARRDEVAGRLGVSRKSLDAALAASAMTAGA